MIELKIPEVGESVQEALLAQWLKRDGESVRKDDVLFVIETDKVTLEISAPADGILKILVPKGQTVKVGAVVGRIEETAGKRAEEAEKPPEAPEKAPEEERKARGREAPGPAPPERRAPEPSPRPAEEAACAPRGRASALQADHLLIGPRPGRAERGVDLSAVSPQAREEELPRETSCSSSSSMRQTKAGGTGRQGGRMHPPCAEPAPGVEQA